MKKLLEPKTWQTKCLYVLIIAAWVVAIVVGVQLLIGFFFAAILPSDILKSPAFTEFFSFISYALAILIIIFLPPKVLKGRVKKTTREELGLKGLLTWTDLGLSPIGYIVSIIGSAGLTALFSLMPWFNASEEQAIGYSKFLFGPERAIAFIGIVVVAPIMEEIIFRGFLYGKLRLKIPKWVACLVTSLAFGLIHMQWNVGISVFSMSVVNCILREITGTIYAGTLVHMINNGVAFYLVFILQML